MKPGILLHLACVATMALVVSVRGQTACSVDAATPAIRTSLKTSSVGGTATMFGFTEYTSPSTPPKKFKKQTRSGQMTRLWFFSGGCPTYPAELSLNLSPGGLACQVSSTCSAALVSDSGTTVTYALAGGEGGRLILDGNVISPGTFTFTKNGTAHQIGVQINCFINGGWVGLDPYNNLFQVPPEVTADNWNIVQEYTSGSNITTVNNSSRTINGVSSAGSFSQTPTAAYGSLATTATPNGQTRTVAGTGTCTPSGSESFRATGVVTDTLTDEDTEDAAEQRVLDAWVAVPPNGKPWDAPENLMTSMFPVGPAFRTSRGNGFSWTFARVHYEADFDISCEGEYDVIVTCSTKLHNAPFTAGTEDIQVSRKTFASGRQHVADEIKVKELDTDYTLEKIEVRRPCGKEHEAGSPDFKLESIHVELGLGLGARQESAGFLRLEAGAMGAAVYTPAALAVATPDGNSVSVIRTSGAARQIKAPQALADIVTLDASSYEVRFYSPGQVGAQDPGTHIYAVSGTPYVVYRFENPDAASTARLKITETRGSNVRVNLYAYDAGSNAWSLSRGSDLRKESLVTSISGLDTTKTTTIRDQNDTVVSKTTRIYHTFAWGQELTGQILDPDGAALTTSYTFYSDSGDGANYARLRLRTNPDGSWERHTYDSLYRALKTVRPFLDAVPTDAENLCRVTENTYSTLTDADGDGTAEKLTTTVETTLGTETGRSYTVDWSKPVILGGESFTRRSDIRCVASGAAWDAAANLITETLTYPAGSFKDRTRRILNPDGTATLTTYGLDANGQETVTIKTGAPNTAKDDIIDGTRTITFTSAQGQTVGESVSDIASYLALSAWTATQFDGVGRPTRLDYTDGTYETRDYACCGLASTRDRSGMVTSYQYDALGRQTHVTRDGLTTRTAYDADSRVKSVTRIGSDNSEILQGSSTYDLAGRQTGRRDALNRLTAYAQAFDSGTGHTTRTTTNPDEGTVVEVTARDGSRLSVSGTAAAPRNYEYGVEGGKRFTKEILVGPGAATTEWVKTYTDFAGRYCKTLYADDATAESFYNVIGQLSRQVDPDGVTALFAYNPRGEQETTAVDLNANNTIDFNGTDRITKTVNIVATRGAYTVQRSTSSIWETDNSDTPTTVAISEQSTDGLRSWQTVRGLTTTSVTVFDGSGGRTVTTTAPDGVKTIQVYAGDRLSSITVKTATDVQLAAVTYGYDPYGRLETQTDARNGVTSYSYFADDQVHTVTTPDPDTSRSGPGYDAQTTTLAYDDGGRVGTVTQPDGGVVNTTYWPTGAAKRTWGSRTYPVEYTYDPQGRLKTLTTWQDFAANAGQAVTTWNYSPARGVLLTKRYADNSGPSYTYKPSGRLLSRTWARGIITTYGYNAAGDPTGVDYSDATPDVTIAYDRAGRPKSRTDAAGICTWGYHTSGQLDSELYSGGPLAGLSLDRDFDSLSRLSFLSANSASSVLNQIGYGYDQASRLDTVTSGSNTATYGYQPNSSLVGSVTFAQNGSTRLTTNKVYDNLNRLTSISSQPSALSSQLLSAYTYNSANQRTKATREDGTYWNYGYDNLGQVTSSRKQFADASPVNGLDYAWTYDDIGNRKTAVTNGETSSYTSTLLNQYSAHTVPGAVDVFGAASPGATVTLTVDNGSPQAVTRQGEFFSKQVAVNNASIARNPSFKIAGVKNLVGPNDEDAVTEVTKPAFVPQSPEAFIHDADGNLTDDARWHYTWDGENRLIAMETAAAAVTSGVTGQKLEFAYDGQGRRISKKVYSWNGSAWVLDTSILFLHDGWNLVAELSFNSQLSTFDLARCYVWGLDLSGSFQGAGGVGGLLFSSIAGGVPSPRVDATAYDGNGNIIGLVDMATGAKSATYEYNAFGETIISDGVAAAANPFRFSTKYADTETGLVYFGMRYYSSATGRWLNRDPLGEPGGLNLYAINGNDSINYIDPDGLNPLKALLNTVRIVAALPFDVLDGDLFRADVIGEKFTDSQCHFLFTVTGINTNREGNINNRDRVATYPEFSHIPSPQAVYNPTFGSLAGNLGIQALGDELGTISVTSRKMAGSLNEAYQKALVNKCSDKCIKIFIEAHSQGGAIAIHALSLVSTEVKKHVFLTILGGQWDSAGQGLGGARNIHNKYDIVPGLPNQPSKLLTNVPIETFDPASLGIPKGQEDGPISAHTLLNDATGGDGSYYIYRKQHPW
jgi:RHS repeat-associated protein